jgi:hypothetical protein
VPLAALTLSLATPLGAQSLRSQVSDLFRFGECGEALCLQVNAAVHGLHFAPSASAASGTLIDFFTDAIGSSVSNIPISSSSGGVTFTFRGAAPVKTSISAGPIFAERAQTLGRGRLLVGANVTSLTYSTFRGLPLDEMVFDFTHQNVGDPTYGVPAFENDVIRVRTKLDLDLLVSTAFVTYGLLDKVDVSVAVPFVHTSLSGTSVGEVIPFGPDTPHFFGTPANASLTATASTSGSSTGIGDIAARLKINLVQTETQGFALFGDVRLPTGKEEDLLGSGDYSVRALGVYSGRYGAFSPHVNGGVLVRGGEMQNNAALATVGFDELIGSSFTFATDLISEIQLGDNKVSLPQPVLIQSPFPRTIIPTNLPGSKDHVIQAAIGTKYTAASGLTGLLNALIPVRAGGLQASVVFTAGLEYSF